jgi:hypothetical protein
MIKNLVIVTILLACSSLVAAPQASVTATTEAPVLLNGTGVAFAMPEEEYRKIADRLSKTPNFVPIKRKPAGLTAAAKFGFNLSFGGLNRSWILDGDEKQGYVLYADLNGNGDLADDTPLRFKTDHDKYFVLLKEIVTEKIDGREENYPVELRLEVGVVTKSDQSDPQPALTISSETLRRGVIRAADREVLSL